MKLDARGKGFKGGRSVRPRTFATGTYGVDTKKKIERKSMEVN